MKKIAIFLLIALVFTYLLFSFYVFFFKEKSDEKVLTFASWGSQTEVEIIRQVISEFEEKNQNVKVNFLHIPQNYFQKIHLLFASDLQPDVVFINNQAIQMYIDAGLLYNLAEYIDETIFFTEALECFKKENKIYAVPRDISNLVLFYNKDIISKQNVVLPDKIKDLNELKNILINLTTDDYWGINSEEDILFLNYYLASNGGGILSDNKNELIVNTEKTLDALKLVYDFQKKYKIAPTKADIGSMTTAQMFINGKLAMYLGGRWMVPKFRDTISFDWDVIEFPSSSDNKLYIDSSGWAISKKSKNIDLAIDFVTYLSSNQSINKFASSGLIIPARKDSAEELISSDKNKKPQNSIAFINMIKESKPTPVNKNYNKINDIIKDEFQFLYYKNDEDFNIRKTTLKEIESLI